MRFFSKSKAHSNDREDNLRILDDNTPFAINEAFRALYTKVLYLPISDKCKKIAITSAFSGEGKTYVSINLAISLAKNSDSKKVLLIDMDMRKPRVARLFTKYYNEAAERGGLSEYLASIHDTPNLIPTDIPNLSILFSGKESANPIGLINSARMNELIATCSEQFDYIIIDTPPVGVVSDAVLLADKINGYIMASRADYSNVNELSSAIDALTDVGAEVYGVVLSSVNLKSLGTYGKSYQKSGYHYYSHDKD